MPNPKPLSLSQKKTYYIFEVLGAVMLAFGLYMGFATDSGAVFVFALLGGSVVLFATPLSLLLKQHAYRILDPAKAVPVPKIKADPMPEIKADPLPEIKADPMSEAEAETKREAKDASMREESKHW
jgi:hypothetical protein